MTSETSSTKIEANGLPVMFASLRMKGVDLDPTELSDFFGVQPALAYRRGDAFAPNAESSLERHRRFGLWLYSTEKGVESSNLGEHLDKIRSVMGPAGRVRTLVTARGYELLVSIFWFGPAGQPLPVVAEPFSRLVETAGGSLELDFDNQAEQDGHRAA